MHGTRELARRGQRRQAPRLEAGRQIADDAIVAAWVRRKR
jgi:hypothetical protein